MFGTDLVVAIKQIYSPAGFNFYNTLVYHFIFYLNWIKLDLKKMYFYVSKHNALFSIPV